MEYFYDFPYCVTIVYSMHFPVEFYPPNNPEDYYIRKSEYAVHALIFVDYYGKILHAELGWPSSFYNNSA